MVRVTSLAAHGAGSLAEALDGIGARVVEFAVAGVVDLGGRSLKIARPNVTIAGETASSPGLTLVNGGLSISTHDVILRHIRMRSGDGTSVRKREGLFDGISTGHGAHDVIVDHCSISWASDENLSASGPRFEGSTPDEWRRNTSHRITFAHNLIGEGINETNTKGTLVHDNATDVAIIGNLYVSHDDRHPLFKGGVRAAAVNNFIYNPGKRVMQYGFVPAQWKGRTLQRAELIMVGNVARKGPSSHAEMVFFEVWPSYGPCDIYLKDNLFLGADGAALSSSPGFRDKSRKLGPLQPAEGMRFVESPSNWPPRLKALPATEAAEWVLRNAGARPWERDSTDRRMIEEIRQGAGRIIRSQRAQE